MLNGAAVKKPKQMLHVGDCIAAPQGRWYRTVRVLAFGSRRGPTAEARLLYEEIGEPTRLGDAMPEWEPLLADNED
jgi:ribosome-associated heat shock protein Hsp15